MSLCWFSVHFLFNRFDHQLRAECKKGMSRQEIQIKWYLVPLKPDYRSLIIIDWIVLDAPNWNKMWLYIVMYTFGRIDLKGELQHVGLAIFTLV